MPCSGRIGMRVPSRNRARISCPSCGRIESRQTLHLLVPPDGRRFVTAALALSIALGVYMALPRSNPAYLPQTYIEALADANPLDTPDIVGPVRLDLPIRAGD